MNIIATHLLKFDLHEWCKICKNHLTGIKIGILTSYGINSDCCKHSVCCYCIEQSSLQKLSSNWYEPKNSYKYIAILETSVLAQFLSSIEETKETFIKNISEVLDKKPVYWKFKAGDVRIKEWKKKDSTVEFTLENGSSNEISIADFESHTVMVNE